MGEAEPHTDRQKWLLCRVGPRLCGLPLACVAETMRMLAVTPLADTAGCVGAAIIRGVPIPVVDAGTLFGEPQTSRRRLVTIDVGDRLVALAVDDVLSITAIADDVLRELPPLLRGAAANVVQAIGSLDGEFLVVLEASRLVPDSVLEALSTAMPAA
jgi:purine-binding chemotaxis protein CheW